MMIQSVAQSKKSRLGMKQLFILTLCMIKVTIATEAELKKLSDKEFWINIETGQRHTFKINLGTNGKLEVNVYDSFWHPKKTVADIYVDNTTRKGQTMVVNLKDSTIQTTDEDGRTYIFQTKIATISEELKQKMKKEEEIVKKIAELNENEGWSVKEKPDWKIFIKRRISVDQLEIKTQHWFYFLEAKNQVSHCEYETSSNQNPKITVNLQNFTIQVTENGKDQQELAIKKETKAREEKEKLEDEEKKKVLAEAEKKIREEKEREEREKEETRKQKETQEKEDERRKKEAQEKEEQEKKNAEEKHWCYPEGYFILLVFLSIIDFLFFRWCFLGRSPFHWICTTEEFISDEFSSEEFII